jgi:hypothetical protein
MGDKGKKDKDKGRKQKINKQEQKAKEKSAKQPERTWSFLSFYPKSKQSWKSSRPLGLIPCSAVLSG